MSDRDELAARVQELESRMAFQDDTIDRLNEVIRAQWDTLDALAKRLQQVEDRLAEVENRMPEPPVEPPPHY